MIIGKDINPQKQIYYLSALIIKELQVSETETLDYFAVYHKLKAQEEISINLYSLSLDWLFLLGAIKQNKDRIEKCF
jgi:hypothetical protein